MNFIIPMAGEGKRFKDAGYTVPKYLIDCKGKTLLQWSVDSLPLNLATNLVFIILKKHEDEFNVSEVILQIYGKLGINIRFYFLDGVTQGQAETVYLGRNLFTNDKPLVIFNIDTYFDSKTLETNLLKNDCDGYLGCFKSSEPRFSFASVDHGGFVTETAEKVVISDNALTGLYHFNNTHDYIDAVEYHLQNEFKYKNEYYIAPMYNYLINKGKKYKLDWVHEFHILGTPEELDDFKKL